jgi:hypothetical protein
VSLDYYQRQIQGHQQALAKLQDQKTRALGDVAQETQRAHAAEEAASRATSESTRKTKRRDAQRHREAAVRHQKRVAGLEGKIGRAQAKIIDASKRLAAAQKEAERKQTRQQQQTEREHELHMQDITERLASHQVAIAAIEKLRHLPDRITVLYLAANPLDKENLRLDEEARSIAEMIRKSEHRDAVHFDSRWALRPLDLLQALNEAQPRVVHFSGHGSVNDEIVFQDNDGHAKLVSKEAIVQTIAAASGDVQLVFFNTCYSRGQAEAVVRHVPAAIGMNTSIGDDAARVFSAQFYSAIGFGLSLGKAFDQAKAALMLESIPEQSTPELFVTEGLRADDLVLVRPPANV